jgi:hypothetical protein
VISSGSTSRTGAAPHYQLALDWWAGAPDELARDRYLMVWRLARPPG